MLRIRTMFSILAMLLLLSGTVAAQTKDDHKRQGVIYAKAGQYDKAIEEFSEAIRLDRNDSDSYFARGLAYSAKNQFDKSVEDYTKAIALNPMNAEAFMQRGFDWPVNQPDRAIEDFSKVIALNPNNEVAYFNRGGRLLSKSQFDGAIEDFNKAISLDSSFAEAFNARAMAYALKGGPNENLISDLNKACKLGLKVACENLARRKSN